MKIRSYKDLEIYKLSFELAMEMHEISLNFPKLEIYEEGSQLRRSTKSIPANIAEGWGRRYYKNEFIKFLIYALASCDETMVHLDFIARCQYITTAQYRQFNEQFDILGKKINKFLQNVMKSHLVPQNKPRDFSGISEDLEIYVTSS